MEVTVEISNRHIHLSREDYNKLFDAPMNNVKDLSQRGEFASDKTVEVEGLGKIRVLGPLRPKSQLEISKTESRKIKKQIHLRLSGHLDNAMSLEISTDKGTVEVPTIIAKRHLHCSQGDAEVNELRDGEIVSVKVDGERGITFHEVVVRVKPSFTTVLHIDTDEGNAAGINEDSKCTIIKNEL